MATNLTLEDVAFLYDGLGDDMSEELARRLSRLVRRDSRFAEQISRLEAIANEAGLPRDQPNRLTEAFELTRDLERLLEAGDGWEDPAEILDPDGSQGIEVTALANLARAVERRRNPPPAIREVCRKLVRALDAIAAEEALVESFVRCLLERPGRAPSLLREVKAQFLARSPIERPSATSSPRSVSRPQ